MPGMQVCPLCTTYMHCSFEPGCAGSSRRYQASCNHRSKRRSECRACTTQKDTSVTPAIYFQNGHLVRTADIKAAAMADKVIKVEELKKHNSDKSCWLAINGKVYDVTPFLEEHPGGYDIILTSTGARLRDEERQDPAAWALERRCLILLVSALCRQGCNPGFRGDRTQQLSQGAAEEVLDRQL